MKKPLVLFACLSLSATLTGCSFLGQSKSSPLSHNGNHSASSIASFDDTFSTTSIEIDPDEPYLYDIGSVNTLNGLFRLDASKQKLRNITDRLDIEGIHSYNSERFSGDICEATDAPVKINQTGGEKLVIVGNEYRGSDKFSLYPASFIGYSNLSGFSGVKLEETIAFQGADVSKISEDYKAVNEALQGTGLHYYRCLDDQSIFKHLELILSDKKDQTVTYSVYKGTQSVTNSVQLTHPCYLVKEDDIIRAPIQKTQDGYFIVDTSSLKPGTYVLDGVFGWYAVEIQ